MSVSGVRGPQHPIGKVARAPKDATPQEKLRGTAQQLQGVFVEQLFKAMRATVPEGGLFSGGQGEEMFRGLMDQRIAETAPDKWTGPHSLGATIVRQLSRALTPAPTTAAPIPDDR